MFSQHNFIVYLEHSVHMMHHSHDEPWGSAFILICEQTSRFVIHLLSLHSLVLKLYYGQWVLRQISHGGPYFQKDTVSKIHIMGNCWSSGNFNTVYQETRFSTAFLYPTILRLCRTLHSPCSIKVDFKQLHILHTLMLHLVYLKHVEIENKKL